MKRFFKGILLVGMFCVLIGCGDGSGNGTNGNTSGETEVKTSPMTHREKSNGTIIIDYAEYPENFMIQLLAGQEYSLKNGDTTTAFCANTKGLFKSSQTMTFGKFEADLSSCVYYRQKEPVLIHYNGNDYIWICEESKSGELIAASVYYVTPYDSLGSDTGIINVKIGDTILDPNKFAMSKSVKCFGSSMAKVCYKIDEKGKPEEIQTDDEYYYIEHPYIDEKLCLKNDIHTWVYADADSKKSSVETIPAGTTFYRLRVPKNEEYSYVEGLLEDGRVFRVVEEYWFSEPTAYQAMMDKDGNQFDYCSVDSDEK